MKICLLIHLIRNDALIESIQFILILGKKTTLCIVYIYLEWCSYELLFAIKPIRVVFHIYFPFITIWWCLKKEKITELQNDSKVFVTLVA